MNPQRLEEAIAAIRQARAYTNDLLDHIDETDWFRSSGDGVTHVGWQVGHLAVAQRSLTMTRIRGERREDEALISSDFAKLFGKGSRPVMDAGAYPPASEIRAVFQKVHSTALDGLGSLSAASLDEPAIGPPHRVFSTKLGALHWAAQHEFLHAGQIGLLRRQLGSTWLR